MRYTMFLLAVLGSAATAIAAIAPASMTPELDKSHITVIEKNQAFPQIGPLIVEDCTSSDCFEASTAM